MQHINFLFQQDFFDSLNCVMDKAQTPVLIYDKRASLLDTIRTNNFENLAQYWTTWDKKKFNNLIDSRLKNKQDYFILIYVIDLNFSKIINVDFLELCKNLGIYFRILTPDPILENNRTCTVYGLERKQASEFDDLDERQKAYIINLLKTRA